MFPYVPFALAVFLIAAVISIPSTVRRVRANESDLRCSMPAFIALGAAALITGAVFLGFLFNAQGIKAEEVTKQRAANVGYAIQSEWMVISPGSDDELTDLAMSDMDVFKDNKDALERGETISFKSESGKEVTVSLTPNTKGSAYYDAKVTYDGKVVESVSRTYKEDGIVDIESKNAWANSYPLLNLKPVGKNA